MFLYFVSCETCKLRISLPGVKYVHMIIKHLESWILNHVLVRSVNTTTVAYINRQGELRSRQLYMLARKLILWSCGHLLSLRATHVPGVLNTDADLLSRGAPVYGEWTLKPEIVEQIWARYGRAAVNLFAWRENAQYVLFYSLHRIDAPLRVDAIAHAWPHKLFTCTLPWPWYPQLCREWGDTATHWFW